MSVRYAIMGWIHCDDADDFPISMCIGEYPDTDEGLDDAVDFARELLLQIGSKDLTDFEVFSIPSDFEKCVACVMNALCYQEVV